MLTGALWGMGEEQALGESPPHCIRFSLEKRNFVRVATKKYCSEVCFGSFTVSGG